MLLLPVLFAVAIPIRQMQGNADISKPLYPQMFPQPTGNNGYEEYVQAADMIRSREFKALDIWMPGADQYEMEPTGDAANDRQQAEFVRMKNQIRTWRAVEVRREQIRLFDRAWETVVRGNLKPLQDPRPVIDEFTTLPELTQFKSLAKLGVNEAYIKFSAGNTAGGTGALLDDLIFAHKIGRGTLVNSLVGIASTSIALSGFQTNLGMLSLDDTIKVQPLVTELLKDRPGVATGLKKEGLFSLDVIGRLLDAPDAKKVLQHLYLDTSDPEQQKLPVALANATKDQKAETKAKLEDYFALSNREIEVLFDGPEKGWPEGLKHILADAPTDPLSRLLLEFLSISGDQVIVAAAKEKTQLRLLRLHAAIIEFRWENDRLPKDLAELGKPDFAHDPLTGKDFVYRIGYGSGYELYSEGHPSIGRIDLKYRRQPGFTPPSDDKPPPGVLGG